MTDGGGKIHFARSRKLVLTILLCVGKREQDFSRGINFANTAWKSARAAASGHRCERPTAHIYCRVTTRRPRRQPSAKPTRVLSSSGERKRSSVSVDGWKRSAGATR